MSPSFVFAGDAKTIAAGFAHSLVLKTDGTVWASGGNRNGQLGDGTNTQRPGRLGHSFAVQPSPSDVLCS